MDGEFMYVKDGFVEAICLTKLMLLRLELNDQLKCFECFCFVYLISLDIYL